MQLLDGQVVVSATDLVGFLACDHLATLELGRARGLWERPPEREDPELMLLREHGEAHEQAYLERLRAEGRSVHEVTLGRPQTREALRGAEEETLRAMRAGVEVIYQATFFDGRWRGHADFLLRVEHPSNLGPWSYEVADTKLSRGVKGAAILQVCSYADRLTQLQGVSPELIHIVTGDGTSHAHRLDDFAAFYRTVKRRFEERIFGAGADDDLDGTYPDPVGHCRVCAWFPTCIERRRADDHPSLVAGMTRSATERLMAAGVPTLEALGSLPRDGTVEQLSPRVLARLREQARMQLEGRRSGELLYGLIVPADGEVGRGLALLPDPSPGDLFWDIEADPWAEDDGLEYLLGLVEILDGQPIYVPLWGTDREGERRAFETFVDTVIDRLDRYPAMHVYHYAGYESGALRRLSQRHPTREEAVDRILRGEVLVDLYAVVRQAIRASVESYSIKKIEKFYMPAREGPVTEAGFSVVTFELWLREGRPELLDDIAAYNRDDCISTWRLRSWLEERRLEAIGRGWSMPRPPIVDGRPSEALIAQASETGRRVAALEAGVPADPADGTEDERGRWLLAQLLDWHRRDQKPEWWRWFELRDKTPDELIDEPDAIGGLAYVGDVEVRKKRIVRRYRFPPQDHRFRVGATPLEAGSSEEPPPAAGEVTAVDDIEGTIDLLRPAGRLDLYPAGLLPGTPIPTIVQRDALRRVADGVLEGGLDGPGSYRAARDLILRRPPRLVGGLSGGPLAQPGESTLDAARRLALELRGGVLAIQGPPGTGKTWTAARMIAGLIHAGRTVGVTAQSHKAITNLLEKTWEACRDEGVPFRAIQRCDTGDDGAHLPGVELAGSTRDVPDGLAAGTYDAAAGTAWLFAREEMLGAVDVLFVDEAGQVSLANAIAMSGAADSLVLVGDPNQLPQVSQGVHPLGAGASSLEHLVGDRVTVPEDLGLFLGTTYRLHPDVNAFISEAFYERRLLPDPSTARQRLGAPPPEGGTGIRWRPVVHAGDDASSAAEAEAVATAIAALLGTDWTDSSGATRPLRPGDLIVVAPYNAHVALVETTLRRRLGHEIAVGTVDRFQGQEAPVAIYTMAASSADDAPRGMDFLYERNRLNVAVSRAKGLAIVVASPDLLRVAPRTPEQMRRANALCRLVEVAGEQTSRGAGVARGG